MCPWLKPSAENEDEEAVLVSAGDLIVEMDEARLHEEVLARWGAVLPADIDACARREAFLRDLLDACGLHGPVHWTREEDQCHRWLPEEVFHSLDMDTDTDNVPAMYDVTMTPSALAEKLGWSV